MDNKLCAGEESNIDEFPFGEFGVAGSGRFRGGLGGPGPPSGK